MAKHTAEVYTLIRHAHTLVLTVLLLLTVHARLQNLTVVLEALGLVFLGRWRGLELHIGVADAENVGRHDDVRFLKNGFCRCESCQIVCSDLSCCLEWMMLR